MKQYKRMYCASFPYMMLGMGIVILPMALTLDFLNCLFQGGRFGQVFGSFLLVMAILIPLSMLIPLLITFIINRFQKALIIVNDETIRCYGQVIHLDRVQYLTLYLPEMGKWNHSSQQLSLYVDDDEHMLIKRPPISLIIYLKRKCKNAKFSIEQWKEYLKLLLSVSVIMPIIIIILHFFA